MSGATYWVGLIHIAAYTLLGGSALLLFLLDRTFKNLGVARAMIEMYAKVLREKRQNKDMGA